MPYPALYDQSVPPAPVTASTVGEFLRCSLGLSAWKQFQSARWALRVNPSSGNLHPTEGYVVWNGRVCHYAPREHALEVRCEIPRDFALPDDSFAVGLTSIFWREAWKYGERAFRYCQHDVGHAIGALRFAAALLGWRATLLPRWGDAGIGALLGVDRDDDFGDAEREEPECVLAITAGDIEPWRVLDPDAVADAARRGAWHGMANMLSPSHVPWPIIDEIAKATRYDGGASAGARVRGGVGAQVQVPAQPAPSHPFARDVILQRRSAVAFNPAGRLPSEAFFAMLQRLHVGAPPWDAIDWPPQVHLALFVHRVDGLAPGVYTFVRDGAAIGELRAAMRPEFLWEPIAQMDGLFFLMPYDMTWPANRLSCDQDIAADGFFSLGMLARFEAALRERGPSFYRRLFWECGLVGQVLYLDAEAYGARSTGIGCFYDEPVHATLGLSGHGWQSLYHFSMGVPVEDARLTTEGGYREDF